MRNAVLTVLGQKGAGKTTFTRYLLSKTTRAVVVDRFLEYEGVTAARLEPAVDYLAVNWRGPFRLVCRFTSDLHYRELFRFVDYTAQRCPTLPLSLLIEEADFFARTNYIEPSLGSLYAYGRHWAISLLSVARLDTNLHRSVIGNSDVLVCFRTRKLSGDMRERFTSADQQRLLHLETLRPGVEPQKGRHYLTFPEDEDPVAVWIGAQAPALATPGPPG